MNKSLSLILHTIPFLKKVIYEGQHSIAEHDYAAQKLKEFYTDCELKLSHDSEFLFFAGIMMYIREWYFGKEIKTFRNVIITKKSTIRLAQEQRAFWKICTLNAIKHL